MTKGAGIVQEPNGQWMKQIARNLTDAWDGCLLGKRYVIFDQAAVFSNEFQRILKAAGVKPVVLPPKSPNLNSRGPKARLQSGALLRFVRLSGSLRQRMWLVVSPRLDTGQEHERMP